VSNSLDPNETPRYSVSGPDPSLLQMALRLCLVGLGVKVITGDKLDTICKSCEDSRWYSALARFPGEGLYPVPYS